MYTYADEKKKPTNLELNKTIVWTEQPNHPPK